MRSQRRKYALNFRRKLYVTYIYVILCYITLDHIIILLMLHICYMLHCVMSCYYHESEFWLWYTVYIHIYTFSISRYICVRIIYIYTHTYTCFYGTFGRLGIQGWPTCICILKLDDEWSVHGLEHLLVSQFDEFHFLAFFWISSLQASPREKHMTSQFWCSDVWMIRTCWDDCNVDNFDRWFG